MQVNPPEPHCLRYPPTTAAHHTQRACKARGIANCKKGDCKPSETAVQNDTDSNCKKYTGMWIKNHGETSVTVIEWT